MGIYTDYGRFQKARQFKDYCTSGAGIWFSFSIGSPRWDSIVRDSYNVPRPNTPPSSPAAYTPLYRWFASYKGGELVQQEYALLDRSFCTDSSLPSPFVQDTIPTDQDLHDNPSVPEDSLSPSLCFGSGNPPSLSSQIWGGTLTRFYPSPYIPVSPVGYEKDWEDRINNYTDPVPPTDPSQYTDYAYNTHIQEGLDSSDREIPIPLGLLAFIQGTALFVEPIEEDPASTPIDNIKTFKYGSHYWKIVNDSDINPEKLPHHILLTVSVFPNELNKDSIVEQELPVRQVSVFKFPDSLESYLFGVNTDPIPRSLQVLRRENINLVYYDPDTQTNTSESSVLKNIPFNCKDPLHPNNDQTPTIEMLINDFMTARKRDVQQTDRYGYIIGF